MDMGRRAGGRPAGKLHIGDLHPHLNTFERFVAAVQRLLPPKPATETEKGHVTGHSFRRGFTLEALRLGIPLERIMIHGDWSHEEPVLSAYAVGAVLPSVCIVPTEGLRLDATQSAAGVVFPQRPAPILNAAKGRGVDQDELQLQLRVHQALLRSNAITLGAESTQRERRLRPEDSLAVGDGAEWQEIRKRAKEAIDRSAAWAPHRP